MKTYVGKCVECGGRMFYNGSEERLEVIDRGPGCLCHFDWPEDEKEEKENGN
uniref:Uncharacterized protein n=1 Tax=viral metagenome TaxID=1070528 RepID=A0A6H1ZCN1_9ZZZZ